MKKSILLPLFVLLSLSISAQKGNIFNAGIVPENEIRTYAGLEHELEKTFKEFSIFEINTRGIYHYIETQDKSNIHFQLNLDNLYHWNFSLGLNDLRTKNGFNTYVQTDTGIISLPQRPASTYRGYLSDIPDSKIRVSIRENNIIGMVYENGKYFFIEAASRYDSETPGNWFIVYNNNDVIIPENTLCGTKSSHEQATNDETELMKRSTVSPCSKAKIAIAADGSVTAKFGTVQNVEDEVFDIFNTVEERYLHPEISIMYEISALFISNAVINDPWAYDMDFSHYLFEFRQWGEGGGFGTNDYATASLWTSKDFDGPAVGLAFVGFICGSNRYNVNQHYTSNYTQLVQVQTHELGHNWSAPHVGAPNNVYVMSPSIGSLNDQWHENSIASISSHKNSRTCLNDNCEIAPVSIFSINASITCNGTVNFMDNSFNHPVSWQWDFGDGNTSTEQHPTHTYTESGDYTVSLTTNNDYGENTFTRENVSIQVIDKPETMSDERCQPGLVNLFASGVDSLFWYDSLEGEDLIHKGDNYTVELDETKIYYVESSTIPEIKSVGPESHLFASGMFFNVPNDNWGLEFDVLSPLVIKSVKVLSSLETNRIIEIYKNSILIYSDTFFIPTGENRIELNANLDIGEGYLMKVSGNSINLYLNFENNYPYEIDGMINITGNNVSAGTNEDFYYYFYDWEVHSPGCRTERSEVIGAIDTTCQEVIQEGIVTVYPNPSDGLFGLIIDLEQEEDILIEVFNMMGQRIYFSQFKADGKYTSSVNLSNQASGVYSIRIKVKDHVYRKKLIKN